MANIFEKARAWFFEPLFGAAMMERLTEAERYRNYRQGNQRRQLRVRVNQHDDNVTLNFTGLVVDRSVTMLFGKGVEFDLPGEGATPEDEYIAAVWAASKVRATPRSCQTARFMATSYTRALWRLTPRWSLWTPVQMTLKMCYAIASNT